MRYTFGHTDIAAERLRSIAGFFNPLAAEFIRSYLDRPVAAAADLGCGPGYTTCMLAGATEALETTGFDISDYFIRKARQQYPDLCFKKQDVACWNTDVKFNVLYCRFLLSHLKQPAQILKSWKEHLNPGGLLFIYELEDIHTQIPVFQKYLKMNSILIQSEGAELYAGKLLDKNSIGVQSILCRSDLIPVDDWQAAGWFYPNTIGIWNEEDIVVNSLTRQERIKISEDLLSIFNARRSQSNITWKMKRIIITT